ncbi:hypothetical protein FH972_002860 [Carpinus fangiana]|uniref:Uncharacterized protein n=1 Tax=Carpinus fangiana TaxID=176857 RepID=A0A5N6QG56_9ROSI|nr:hypothetical protein FH972_002860 [Carpinus fangiana]
MRRGSWMSEASGGGASSNQAKQSKAPVGKDVVPATNETDEMDETSNYGQGAVKGVNPGELRSINGHEFVTGQKSPADMGDTLRAENGEEIRKTDFINKESETAIPRSNEREIFAGSFNKGAEEKELNGIFGKEYEPENKSPSGEGKVKPRGLLGNKRSGSGAKNSREGQTWKRRARAGQQ